MNLRVFRFYIVLLKIESTNYDGSSKPFMQKASFGNFLDCYAKKLAIMNFVVFKSLIIRNCIMLSMSLAHVYCISF